MGVVHANVWTNVQKYKRIRVKLKTNRSDIFALGFCLGSLLKHKEKILFLKKSRLMLASFILD